MRTTLSSVVTLLIIVAPLSACDTEDDSIEDRVAEDEYHIVAEDGETAEDVDITPLNAADSIAVDNAIESAFNFFEPVGTLDQADCSKIAGWVKDGDTTAPTWAAIRTAPWPGGQAVATPVANLYRAGLPFADKNHGFSINTPAWLKDGNTHTIFVHGINVDTNGNWDVTANSPLLNLSGRQFCCGAGCFPGDGGFDDGPDIP